MNLLFYYCFTYRLHLILSITRSWYQDWRIVSALGILLLIGFVHIFGYVSRAKGFVSVNGIDSSLKDLQYGVPQGSVLGPFFMFTLHKSIG